MCFCNKNNDKCNKYCCYDCGSIFHKLIDLKYHMKYYHFESLDEQSYLISK